MSGVEKHPAEVLAESIHCGCQAPNGTCKYDDADAMLRTIPQLEAERDQWQASVWALARELNCLPSTFADANGHVLKAAIKLNVEVEALRADAERYRWLRDRLMGADFDWNESGVCALVFEWPADVPVGAGCDENIDSAMAAGQTPEQQGGTA